MEDLFGSLSGFVNDSLCVLWGIKPCSLTLEYVVIFAFVAVIDILHVHRVSEKNTHSYYWL